MSQFEHFVLTAFNVDIGKVKPGIDRAYITGEEYLSKRLDLFEKFCYPSLYHQSNQNFQWLIFLDRDTPDSIKARIETLARWKNLIPLYTPPGVKLIEFIGEYIHKNISADTRFIITSRIDSDDAVSRDYIEIIQDNFAEQDFEFINFPLGYSLRKEGLFLREYLSSPFLSLIEKADSIITCKAISHVYALPLCTQGVAVRQIVTHPVWLQTVHDKNWLTSLDINAIPQPLDDLNKHFTISEVAHQYAEKSYLEYLRIYLRVFILKNKYKIPLYRRIRAVLSILFPPFIQGYLKLTLPRKFPLPDLSSLSAEAARSLCLEKP